MKYIKVVGVLVLACATTALADCLLPYDIDEAGSCGGKPQEPVFKACQLIVYAPDHRSECDPNPTGTYTCNNVIAHVMKETYQLSPIRIPDEPDGGICLWVEVTSTSVDTGELCLQGQPGTDTCP